MLYIYSFHLNDVPILRFIVLTQSYVMCTLKKTELCLLFDWLEFSSLLICCSLTTYLLVWLNPHKSNRSSAKYVVIRHRTK